MPVCSEQTGNIWIARIIPVLLVGVVGYSVYVVVALLSVNRLLDPSETSIYRPRHGAGIAVITLDIILLLPMAISYFRLLYTIVTNPGFVPRGPQWYAQEKENSRSSRHARRKGYSTSYADTEKGGDDARGGPRLDENSKDAMQDLTQFYNKEVYSCKGDGKPPWCSHCMQWKPDRAHHCSQIGRCVFKMDHFCPWVGGIIGETTFKFFIQFLVYAAFYCAFVLVTMAIFVAETVQKDDDVDNHWIVMLALSGVFFMFSAGMAGSSIYFAFENLTTIENLSKKAAIWYFAVRLPPSAQVPPPPSDDAAPSGAPPPVTYSQPTTDPERGPINSTAIDPGHPPPIAVLRTEIGENPWDMGPLENWKSVMGNRVIDWFLPIRNSPICDHDGYESAYPLGPVVHRLRQQFGLASDRPGDPVSPKKHRRRRTHSGARKHRRSETGSS